MIRIVLDTNVIVSALAFGGVPRTVLQLAESGHCRLFFSEPIQVEVRRVLSEKFRWSTAMLDRVSPVLWNMGEQVVPKTAVDAVPNDPDDNRILECAMAARADFIVSGDHHLLALGRYKTIEIVTPRGFLDKFTTE